MSTGARYVQSSWEQRARTDARALRAERLVDGATVPLGDVAGGQPLLLVFWTTWCQYCKQDLDGGARLAAELAAGRVPTVVAFVDVLEPRAAVEAQTRGREQVLADRILLDTGGDVARSFGIEGFPSYILLDREGKTVWREEGLQSDLAAVVGRQLGPSGGGDE